MNLEDRAMPAAVWAVVPVKPLYETKSRLRALLSVAERAALTQTLLAQTLRVLQVTPGIDRIAVVTRDLRVTAIATAHDAWVVTEPSVSDLNRAMGLGQKHVQQQEGSHVLFLPSDLPFMSADDVSALLQVGVRDRQTAVLCSDRRDTGTNALLLPTAVSFQFQYGVNSFQLHRAAALAAGLRPVALHIPGLRFDLDTEADWQVYQACSRPAYAGV